MPDLRHILTALRKEEQELEKQLSKIRNAIGALADDATAAVTRAQRVAKKAKKKMTAAQKRVISERMKQYWAARKKKAASLRTSS